MEKVETGNVSRQKRKAGFYGAIGMFLTVIAITISLFFFEIPEKNNDVIKLIIGVLVGSISPIVYSILGKDGDEIEKKNLRIEYLESENKQLKKRTDHLEEMFMNLQAKVIDKLSLLAEEKEPSQTKE